MIIDRETIAVVTGAGSGIGRALALQLAQRCGGLAIADINEAGLAETAALIVRQSGLPPKPISSCRTTTHLLDVSDREAVASFARDVEAAHGAVHLLINNAGVALGGTVKEVSIDDVEWLMGINFRGVLYGVKSFLPILSDQSRAHIVNISSVFGIIAPPGQAAYAASKFAVRGFTEALRHELAGSQIGVSVVHPGGIKTNIARSARAGAGVDLTLAEEAKDRFDKLARTSPDKAARVILRGVEKNSRRILIGIDAWLIDRIQRWMPIMHRRLLEGLFGRID